MALGSNECIDSIHANLACLCKRVCIDSHEKDGTGSVWIVMVASISVPVSP